MSRIFSFSTGPNDWKALLADPEKHWRTGYSARTLAHCWEAADGFPSEVASAFGASTDSLLQGLEPLLAVPEFKVPLPGGLRASQNDVFVLGKSVAGPVTIMVEGKVNESFGPTVDEWLTEASLGKRERLAFLTRKLGLPSRSAGGLRYQLLHRTVSAIIAGEQFRAAAAVMLVHSFSEARTGWADYKAFLDCFAVKAEIGVVQRIASETSVPPLFSAWIPGDLRFLRS